MGDDKREMAPGVYQSIVRFNITSRWVGAEILREEDLQTRVSILRHFIFTAEHLMNMKNYSGLLQIVSGLHIHSVYRLTDTFGALTSRESYLWKELKEISDSSGNHRTLWNLMKKSSDTPCLPYLGMFLTSLTYLTESHPSKVNGGQINWTRRKLVAGVIRDVAAYQKRTLNFRSIPLIKDYILNAPVFDDDTHYRLSYYIQPRERKSIESERAQRPPELQHLEFVSPSTPTVVSRGLSRSDLGSNTTLDIRHAYDALVDRLCSGDIHFVSQILIAYHAFTTSEELLTVLFERIRNSGAAQNQEMQMKYIRILRLWIEDHWGSFSRDLHVLFPLLNSFYDEFRAGKEPVDNTVRDSLSELLDEVQTNVYSPPVNTSHPDHTSPPRPIIPRPSSHGGTVTLMDIDPLELARQITLVDQDLLSRVCPWECHRGLYTSLNQKEEAPNIAAIVEQQLTTTGWAQSEILREEELGSRKGKLKYLILVAARLSEMRNYSSCTSIVDALNSKPIRRLKKTFAGLSKSERRSLASLTLAMAEADYQKTRNSLDGSMPSVPRVQIYLEAISTVESLHDSFNFSGHSHSNRYDHKALQKTGQILLNMKRFQVQNYNWIPLPLIQTYLLQAPIADNLSML
eukprot:TRINITY_DN12370_c0_g1_i1.p1 TRINITY_DN12370_c0_g1~~TRINITY_DN12370_c0_g1_i1.p1  ORF type:complete len:718 (-),score=92.71 TRINITY_DN12370_c0_g1_i1:96-1982(-)